MVESKNHQFHIAIVDAGIAGLALAMALHKQDVSFTMYEEAKEYSTVGAEIGFSPNGMRAINLIEPTFRPLYEEICVGSKGEDAKHIFFEGMLLEPGFGCGQSWHGDSAWSHPDFVRKSVSTGLSLRQTGAILIGAQAHRKALLDTMNKFIPPDHARFGKRVAGIEQQSDFVKLGFPDGSTATADIVAGAARIQSVVRSHVPRDTNPSQVAPVYAGAYCYRGVIPMTEGYEILGDLTDVAKFYFGQGRGAVTYRISGGEVSNYLLCVADTRDGWKSKDAVTERVRPDVVMSDFQGSDTDEAFRRLLSEAQPVRWGLFHHLETSTYFRDRAFMIGDSAHASLPFQAAGAAQGLEYAVVLSRILAELANSRNLHATKTSTIHASPGPRTTQYAVHVLKDSLSSRPN
ncbi:hypothetical protein N7539_007000 [Penicillium diatomitis]|uniref:FAD-binding domain-containing protein n=1 Tax=Penicillium diatomitis TaxID=2819901 RepID=A0A9W9X2B9_9EURO|nr:uncharacterized protein N7539_007000 [Penicillium diatomitis]KAJ5481106.1 hypothetical protein N7539_007000 [Penicillium diatomitis]